MSKKIFEEFLGDRLNKTHFLANQEYSKQTKDWVLVPLNGKFKISKKG